MKKFYIFSITLLNLYYFILWLYIFNSFDTQKERRLEFINKWLVFDSINFLNVFIGVATVFSVILIFNKNNTNKYLKSLCLIINILFILFVLWSGL